MGRASTENKGLCIFQRVSQKGGEIVTPPKGTAKFPLFGVRGQSRGHGVGVDVQEGVEIVGQGRQYGRKEPLPPDGTLTGVAVVPVPGHGKDAEDPLHNPRQAGSLPGPENQVEMVSHQAEILQPKAELGRASLFSSLAVLRSVRRDGSGPSSGIGLNIGDLLVFAYYPLRTRKGSCF